MWTMWTVVRDITVDEDIHLILPMEETELNNKLNPKHEYIFINWDCVLNLTEYSSIKVVNDFLLYCNENGVDELTIRILSEVMGVNFCNEKDEEFFIKKLEDHDYEIVDFDEITKNWSYANIHNNSDKGLALYTAGFMKPPFEVTDEMEDWIKWEILWNNATTSGWEEITIGLNFHDYLVRA